MYPVDRVEEAFEKLQGPNKPLLTLLEYNRNLPADLQTLYQEESKVCISPKINRKKEIINVALIGAGGFANDVHLPNLL